MKIMFHSSQELDFLKEESFIINGKKHILLTAQVNKKDCIGFLLKMLNLWGSFIAVKSEVPGIDLEIYKDIDEQEDMEDFLCRKAKKMNFDALYEQKDQRGL